MLHHVYLCLEEIEAEIASAGTEMLAGETRADLYAHIAGMRALLDVAKPVTDDLTLIRGIDASTARHLVVRGVTSFAQITAWTAADVAAMTGEMIAPRRISREGWIEQAAALARGDTTHYARRVANGEIASLVACEPVVAAPITPPAPTLVLPPPLPVQAAATGVTPPPLPPRYLPPLLEGKGLRPLPTEWIMLDRPLVEPIAAVADVGPEMTTDTPTQAEPTADPDAAQFVPAVPSAAVIAAKREPALVRWGRRASLAAMLAVIAGIGLAGIDAKRAGTNVLPTSIVSAD